jgi:AbrB family looped-hinge helix DNA binding protein
MTYKVGPKGQVVLPKRIRDHLGIRPGDVVSVDEVDGEVRIRKTAAPAELRGLLRDPRDAMPLTRSLEIDHKWEIAHDEMRQAEWELRDLSRDRHDDG